jgi:hypothetical protein
LRRAGEIICNFHNEAEDSTHDVMLVLMAARGARRAFTHGVPVARWNGTLNGRHGIREPGGTHVLPPSADAYGPHTRAVAATLVEPISVYDSRYGSALWPGLWPVACLCPVRRRAGGCPIRPVDADAGPWRGGADGGFARTRVPLGFPALVRIPNAAADGVDKVSTAR